MDEQDSARTGARSSARSAVAAAAREDSTGAKPPAAPASPPQEPTAPTVPDRRNQSVWVPRIASLFCLLIGLSDILTIIDSAYHRKLVRSGLHKFVAVVPGTVFAVTGTAVAVTGLMLLMLAYGLRRRKRRAWQATVALLAFNIVIHLVHGLHIPLAVVSLLFLGALLYFSDHFYARGDPRTRWRALAVFCGLAVADVVIGLAYILLARGLAQDYSFPQRLQHVLYGLVGLSGRCSSSPRGVPTCSTR